MGSSHIKFSIDNILNPGFGSRMSPAESAAAAAALHHHHQLMQHHQGSPAAAAAGFLGAFHQLPFLAAARQMILAAASGSSMTDYHNHNLAAQHSASSLLMATHHPTNTLNLVQSCTDKYLGNSQLKSWTPHQPALPSGMLVNKPIAPSSALKAAAKAQQVNNKCSASTKAIDLSVRNSASPPDHRQQRPAIVGEKQSAPQVSPSLASSISTDDNSSAASPTRSVSVSFRHTTLNKCLSNLSSRLQRDANLRYIYINIDCSFSVF